MSERVKREEQQPGAVSGAELKGSNEAEGSTGTAPSIVGYSASTHVSSLVVDAPPKEGFGIGANGTIVEQFSKS